MYLMIYIQYDNIDKQYPKKKNDIDSQNNLRFDNYGTYNLFIRVNFSSM